jgi:hypothetical protein
MKTKAELLSRIKKISFYLILIIFLPFLIYLSWHSCLVSKAKELIFQIKTIEKSAASCKI